MAKTNPPSWAQDFFLQCLCWAEEQGHDVPPLVLEWRQHRPRRRTLKDGHSYTLSALTSFSARALPGLVRVMATRTASPGRLKIMLAHEVAHHIVGLDQHHSPKFWDMAWELFKAMGLPMRATLKAEGAYRQGAVASYQRSQAAQGL